jgi:hypothetical protein
MRGKKQQSTLKWQLVNVEITIGNYHLATIIALLDSGKNP